MPFGASRHVKDVSKIRRSVRLVLHPTRKLFLVVTVKGLDFVDEWFGSGERVPVNLTRLYQFLLQTIQIGGVMSMWTAFRLGYSRDVVNKALSNAYVELTRFSKKPEGEVFRRIKEIVGEPPREIYV